MNQRIRALSPLIAVCVAVACDDVGGNDSPTVSLSFAVAGTGGSSSTSIMATGDAAALEQVLDLQAVDITFARIKLDRKDGSVGTAADVDSDSEADSDEEETIRFGETTVSLPLQGGVITPVTASIPSGDYESIELKIAGVRLRGTFDGQAFDVTLPINVWIERRFSPAFHVESDADKPNITITIDTSAWLRDDDGVLIDPRLLASSASLRAQVVNRIRASIRAFEDADKDADDEDSDSDSN